MVGTRSEYGLLRHSGMSAVTRRFPPPWHVRRSRRVVLHQGREGGERWRLSINLAMLTAIRRASSRVRRPHSLAVGAAGKVAAWGSSSEFGRNVSAFVLEFERRAWWPADGHAHATESR
jgi:hypothetical protein